MKLSVPETHQLKIAKSTLKMSDMGATIMGGMTKAQAREVILRLTGKKAVEEPEEVDPPNPERAVRDNETDYWEGD
jgi:hypothetical protein